MWLPSKKVVIDTSQVSPFDTTFGMSDSMGLMDSTGLVSSDTTAAPDFGGVEDPSLSFADDVMADSSDSDTVQVYFRKKIDLKGTPVEGTIYITADNDFNLFLNEEYITDDEMDNFAIIDTVDYGYLSYSIKPGLNTLALRVTDTDKTRNGVKIYGYLELIPLDILAAMEERSKIAGLDIDPAILKRINRLNKNRITVR